MGELDKWTEAISNLVRSGGISTSNPNAGHGSRRSGKSDDDDDASSGDDSHTHTSRCPDDCDE